MRIPDDVLDQFEEETRGLEYGSATLTVQLNLKTGKPRWIISREKSYFSDDDEERKKTGRSHVDDERVEKAKEFMRFKHPEGVRAIDVAEFVGCTQSRAMRILDLLSKGTEFLVYMDDEKQPTLYYISKDAEKEKAG